MYGRVHQELLIQENYHVLYGSQDLCLDTEGPVRLAELDQCPKHV